MLPKKLTKQDKICYNKGAEGEVSDAVSRYHNRRDKRMGRAAERDVVAEYRKRRGDRLDARFDASARLAYGIASGLGINTEGMSPQEVWEAIKGKDPEAYSAAHSGGKRSKRGQEAAAKAGYVNGWKPRITGMEQAETHVLLSKCNKIGGKNYDKARDVANDEKHTFLWTFTTHGRDHVQQVIDKTNQAADAVEKMPEDSIFRGAKVDRKLMLVSAWFHDTGMDGDDREWGDDNGDGIRSAHGMESALHVLENAKDISKMGVDPNKAAYIAFAHTKSKSGINDLTNPNDWKAGLDKLEAAAKERGIPFDRKAVFNGEEPNEDNIHEMMAQVAALRLGDANREAKGVPLMSQSGGKYDIDVHPDMDKAQKLMEERGYKSKDKWKAEVELAKVSIKDDDGTHVLSDDDPKMSKVEGRKFSVRVVLGEQNMVQVDSRFNEKHHDLQEDISLANGNDVPWCTTEALLERCGELNTINGVPRAMAVYMNGVKNASEMSKTARDAYETMWGRIMHETDKNGNPKFGGVDRLVLAFDDGSKFAYTDETNWKGRK